MTSLSKIRRLCTLSSRYPGVKTLSSSSSSTTAVSPIRNHLLSSCSRYFQTSKIAFDPNKEDTSNINMIPLKKVLIANRGEIACRIQRSCHKWDIPTVAIYSAADSKLSYHAQMANEAYQIGYGSSVSESYLLQNDIIDIAIQSGCDAIHPGYGFLSENTKFAQLCADHNIQFIGPSASAIHQMGDKAQSKYIMDQAGVPTTPGYYNMKKDDTNIIDGEQDDILYEKAIEIGFPLLIKAVAGGGGKGMRIVYDEKDFRNLLESCQRESLNSFGNSAVILEKYLIHPRHIEIQIAADSYGNCIYLYERDCSVQRRYQKVFEEAPAIDLHPALRHQLGTMGVLAAKAVQYENVGTVEFLLDTNDPSKINTPDQPFYFCEMNTRLQVEHPVTEYITGIDLVEWQLRVAAKQTLPITEQKDLAPPIGHAIEARIYAEKYSINPTTGENQFLPATGTLWYHSYSLQSIPSRNSNKHQTNDNNVNATTARILPSVRVDTFLRPTNTLPKGQEQTISVYYDPMISKLIVHGPNRDIALQQLIYSLQHYHVAGVSTNIPFLLKCARHPIFQKGGQYVTTGFLQQYKNDVQMISSSSSPPPSDDDATAAVEYDNKTNMTSQILKQLAGTLAIMLQLEGRNHGTDKSLSSPRRPWSNEWGSWRIGDPTHSRPKQTLSISTNDKNSMISIWKNRDGSYDIQPSSLDGKDNNKIYHVGGWYHHLDNTMEMIVNGTHRLKLTTVMNQVIDKSSKIIQIRTWPDIPHDDSYCWEIDIIDPTFLVASPSSSYRTSISSSSRIDETTSHSSGVVKSPMPGKVTKINYRIGDTIKVGDIVMVIEAMKMEHPLVSTCHGTLTEIKYQLNDVIPKDGSIVFVVTPSEESS